MNRAVVLGCRLQLEAKKLAASTINDRLAAVRRLAYDAADTVRHLSGDRGVVKPGAGRGHPAG
jgi:hypothetical protein